MTTPTMDSKQKAEVWKDIPGYEGYYQVSDFGSIRSLDRVVSNFRGTKNLRGKIMKAAKDNLGYLHVSLRKNGQKEQCLVHKLVMMAFVGPCEGRNTNHLNEIKDDNRLENLEYVSFRENTTYSFKRKGHTTSAYVTPNGNYMSRITLDGKVMTVGTYATEDEANAAYHRVLKFMGLENKYAQ